MASDTGFPAADAQSDFLRARRARVLEKLRRRLRREPDDVGLILPLEEVLAALGRTGERHLGLRVAELDSIVVGTVDRTKEFDPRFRPTSSRLRGRWERMAEAQRRGQSMPPVALYRVGELHFVRDGHHRVSVARALGRDTIDAYVTEVQTAVGAGRGITLADLPLKDHERLFFERVPLPPAERGRVRLRPAHDYARMAEGVEAWGFRAIQERGAAMTRDEVAAACFEREYLPVVACSARPTSAAERTMRPRPTSVLRTSAIRSCAATSGRRTSSAGCRPSWAGRGKLRPEGRLGVGRRTRGRAVASDSASGSQRPAAVGLEEVQLSRVEPQLDLLALGRPAGRIEPRDHLAAVEAPGTSTVPASAASSSSSALRSALPLDAEVGVELGAHRLEHSILA